MQEWELGNNIRRTCFFTDATQKEAGQNGLVGVWVIVRSWDPNTAALFGCLGLFIRSPSTLSMMWGFFVLVFLLFYYHNMWRHGMWRREGGLWISTCKTASNVWSYDLINFCMGGGGIFLLTSRMPDGGRQLFGYDLHRSHGGVRRYFIGHSPQHIAHLSYLPSACTDLVYWANRIVM